MTRKEYRELLLNTTTLEQHHKKHRDYKNCTQCKTYQDAYLQLFKVRSKPINKIILDGKTTLAIPSLVELLKDARTYTTTHS